MDRLKSDLSLMELGALCNFQWRHRPAVNFFPPGKFHFGDLIKRVRPNRPFKLRANLTNELN